MPPRRKASAKRAQMKRPRGADSTAVASPDLPVPVPCSGEGAEWTTARVDGPPLPAWADHFAGLLIPQFRQLQSKVGGHGLELTFWSDCGGFAMELIAMREIAASIARLVGLRLTTKLFCFCDNDATCRRFAADNHMPLHMSSDVQHRNFADGTFHCITCGEDHAFPHNIGVYVCCFPCGPWSRKGKQLGFRDAAGEVVWQALKTIAALKPGVLFMENVTAISCSYSSPGLSVSDLDHICRRMETELPGYRLLTLQNIDPTLMGFPARRNRVALIGARQNLIAPTALQATFGLMLSNPLAVQHDWHAFLGKARRVDLSRVGARATPEERLAILQSGCACAFDPAVLCKIHACGCRVCKGGEMGQCAWRSRHRKYIEDHYVSGSLPYDDLIALSSSLITYCQAVEAQGVVMPSAPRERNLINVVAAETGVQPLHTTLALLDKTQSLGRTSTRVDGSVPTLGVNSSLFSLGTASTLTTAEVARLMGHELQTLNLQNISERQFRGMIGMSLHKGTAGVLMLGLLASLGAV